MISVRLSQQGPRLHPWRRARGYAGPVRRFLLLSMAVACPAAAVSDELFDAVAQARQRCGTSVPLRHDPRLDQAARRLAEGAALEPALRASGYRALRSYQWSLGGYRSSQAAAQALVPSQCKVLGDPQATEAGVWRSGTSYRVVVAVPFQPPEAGRADDVAARVLALVNEARAAPRQCGGQPFQPVRPLALNTQLTQAAARHAQDMAQHGFLAHEGRDGSTPADRATRAGYPWRSIGENVASGQTTPEQVVRDWLRSPEHCGNIMEARFTEMGVAFAVNRASDGGIYWAQVFGRR